MTREEQTNSQDGDQPSEKSIIAGIRGLSQKGKIGSGATAAIIIIAIVIFVFFIRSQFYNVDFIISNSLIENADGDSVDEFKKGENMFFYLGLKSGPLNGDVMTVQIERKENGDYKYYKKITFEIEKSFPKISSYVPTEYLSKSGDYRIKAFIDGDEVADEELTVSE
ncbi:MAG TPA: hypothetical protein PK573_05370 [Spirochaetota bacterium]|nr:hypothetical protein [Spirochaetota bacterium]HRZ25355.1 hypothetical protein [Spirochaetota bacterium]HSA16238.1 hypothetical protein [Spirochaetota bacterium]